MYRKFSKKKKAAKAGLAVKDEIKSQRRRHQQFIQCSSPKAGRGTEPAKQQVPPLVDDQVDVVDDQEARLAGNSVQQKQSVKHQPADECCFRDWLPVFLQRSLEGRKEIGLH